MIARLRRIQWSTTAVTICWNFHPARLLIRRRHQSRLMSLQRTLLMPLCPVDLQCPAAHADAGSAAASVRRVRERSAENVRSAKT